jgi:hypothetical protein
MLEGRGSWEAAQREREIERERNTRDHSCSRAGWDLPPRPPLSLSVSWLACCLALVSRFVVVLRVFCFATVVDRQTVFFLLLDKLSLVISSSFSVWSLGFHRI